MSLLNDLLRSLMVQGWRSLLFTNECDRTLLLFLCLRLHTKTPYTLPWHGASRTPPLWYRIRAKEEGLLEKPLPSESRKLRRKVAEYLVKKGYSEESIGVNKVSGTKQERGNGKRLSEYQSCLRKIHDDDNTFRGTVCNLQRRAGRRSLKNRYSY